MVTKEDRKNLLEKGKVLATTDAVFMANLLGFQKGLDMGITLAMANIQGTDVQMESISDFFTPIIKAGKSWYTSLISLS